jgi:cytochrome c-type biogenesis protein CcmH/NrfG
MDPAPSAIRRVQARPRVRSLDRLFEARRELGPAIAGSVLPFALVFYLALRGGGYDRVVLGEFGIAVWWLVLLGAVVGILPAARISRAGWVVLGLLSAFGVWTALGITWSESAERSAAEAARVAAYLGVFALALAAQGRDGLRRTANAVAAAIALVGVLALLSRLHPAWFPANDAARLLPPDVGNRLGYPLNYWNGLAALLAMGIPLLLGLALRARHLVTRALAGAALPAMALTTFYTFSRGGAIAIVIAVLVFIALYPRRLTILPTLLVSGAGSLLLIGAATQREALEDHVLTDAARTQGDEMLALVLVVCAGVGLLQVAIGLAARHGLGPRPTLSARQGAGIAAAGVAVIAALAVATGLPDELSGRTQTDAAGAGRLGSVSTEGRAEYWSAALDANATAPLTGIGSGTFEFWWARNAIRGFPFIRDAHSLYMETLAELGMIGFALIVLTMGAVLVAGMRRVFTASPERRPVLVAAVASCVAFVAFAGIDWVWELPVVPIAFLLLAGAILGRDASTEAKLGQPGATLALDPSPSRASSPVIRLALAGLAVLSLIAVAVPLASVELTRHSEERLRSGELDSALDAAKRAESLQPYAATPKVQQALVLERSGDLAGAAAAAREATRRESTNWRTWLLLGNVEAQRGQATAAVDAFDEATRLNPRSATPRFQQALALKRSGDLAGAAAAAHGATRREPTNWQTWLLLAKVKAKRGQATVAVNAYLEAARLNPQSPVFQETTPEQFASRLRE